MLCQLHLFLPRGATLSFWKRLTADGLRRYPRLSTEILAIDTPGLTDTLFNPIVASSQPHTCPAPPSFLLPFWWVHSQGFLERGF